MEYIRLNLLETLAQDRKVFCLVHPEKGLLKYIYFPDFRALVFFRLSQWSFQFRLLRPFAYVLTVLNDILHGVWIGPKVQIAPGLFFGHPRGLVVNPGTKIGNYCSILQQVTIGGPNITIGDYVEINAGAKIISNVRGKRKLTIGDNVIIAAGAVVIEDVPDYSIVAGVPARVVKTISEADNWVAFRHRRNEQRF